ncbi:MAG: helical backbone metal receptor [Candidatus Binatus sp.]|uniref:helical backbone metal receptor n=1 Tax=Candidatus Binatus sp. TaxID=2811406 RepID=UPI0027257932|nr:helical backbone metal receptor [Candidatus Binatus sp.]MDO8430898.1 helical backbone metal receptor [Candidatus Binatus sp.]
MAAMVQTADDLGFRVELAHPPRRIVSLVPSWTETLFALGFTSDEVVGVTKYCVEPAAEVASIAKIGGTKNPDIRAIAKLEPELIIANAEENRREDVERMRAAGIPVFTTYPKTVPGAVESILRLGRVLAREPEAAALAKQIALSVSEIEATLGVWSKLRLRVFCPIWKKPWMSFNGDTYAHDVLRMLGYNNVYASAGERYPITTLEAALERRPDIVILPDEPYEFDEADVTELKALLPTALSRRVLLVSGRDLHWYGVHMVRGLKSLAERMGRVRAAVL